MATYSPARNPARSDCERVTKYCPGGSHRREPHQIRLHADREEILADGTDLSFITVEVLDKEGNLCPHANNLVLLNYREWEDSGVDNGNPVSLEPFKASQRMAFHGKCLAVIQSGKTKGTLSLTATSHDLQPASLKIKMR